ncbi:MAG: 50S ribosomal protein L29 [Candidatus Pacebacteria bacterium]|nr:50S ribosomal protein L29 [Candidatus Paceibacterota bacterium]MBP9780840.1 50S ribosomal protein L29 [Candidatus Paceibacterota bacterium]MDQ5949860.1 Ribosomal protein [Patescibacteria group bacterium]
MAKKTMQKIREMNIPDLTKNLKENREQIQKLSFGLAGSKSKNVRLARTTRREIARLLTELHTRNK